MGTATRPGASRGDGLALERVALLAALVLAGCASSAKPQSVDLERFRAEAETPSLYWVGSEFEGFPLTYAAFGTLIYGTCEIEDQGLFTDGGCAPPIQIQNLRFEHRQWSIAQGCQRLQSLRGVPTARHDSLVLFTGRQFVKIYALDGTQERRIAQALRPLEGSRRPTLPPPPKDVHRRIQKACR